MQEQKCVVLLYLLIADLFKESPQKIVWIYDITSHNSV